MLSPSREVPHYESRESGSTGSEGSMGEEGVRNL